MSYFIEKSINDMELLLTTWDAYLQTFSTVYPGDIGPPQQYRDHYIANLAYHLDEKSGNVLDNELAGKLTGVFREMPRRTPLSIVTTNYDRIPERLLDAAGRGYTYNSGYDIGTPFFKLHGSLNWIEGVEGGRRVADGWQAHSIQGLPGGRSILNFELQPLPGAAENPLPVIVPPTISKRYEGYLRQVMLKASVMLRSARRLLFVGYSFPVADLVLERLVKDSLIGANDEQEIVYVNPSVAAVSRARGFLPAHTDFRQEPWSPAHFEWLVDELENGLPDHPPSMPVFPNPPL